MSAPRSRLILHVDLDAFYASVEQRDEPSLRGRPVLVGGGARRGVVAAASYEARTYGVRSAMPTAEALRRCPRAVLLPPRMGHYAEVSRSFFAILDRFAPRVEGLSLDEAFLDASGEERLLGSARDIGLKIKRAVAEELDLVVSVGAAPSKFVAKIASDIDKPDGLRVIEPDEVRAFLDPLPVARLWGAGAVTCERLHALGLRTIGHVARYPEDALSRALGPGLGHHLAALARARDDREVEPASEPVSIGHEETFDHDAASHGELEPVLLRQADRVAARLRRQDRRARTVVVKLKYADFQLVSRRLSLADPTADGARIGRAATELLASMKVSPRRPVRLAGVAVSTLEPRAAPRQLSFDERDRARGERLGDALDRIEARFGEAAIERAAYARRKRR
jgi:DNA polymerase IV